MDRPSRLDKCLDNIVESAERCGDITESVLRFARPQTTEKASADLNAVVEHAVLLTRKYVKERGGTIELQPAPGLPQVLVNAVEMEQVFINLIRNAIEAAAGDIRIVIRTLTSPQGVRIMVQDNGPGVAEDDLEHLFDPFFTTRREKGGTGLGLSIVHGIITRHGGSVGVESCPGKGSTFTIELPAISPREWEAKNAEGVDC
jgi:two-component system NtrC family sensor kinase